MSASPAAGAVVELLKVLLKARAEEAGVASKLIATVSDLELIANDDAADTAALKGWRREAFAMAQVGDRVPSHGRQRARCSHQSRASVPPGECHLELGYGKCPCDHNIMLRSFG